MDNMSKHVDWNGLVYYDGKIKEYIQSTTATRADQEQLRCDLEQLEKLLVTLTDNFTTDKKHMYDHIEACKNKSATKEELTAAVDALHQEIRTLTGVDLSSYATKEEVDQLRSSIPSVEGLASESYVDNKISALDYVTITSVKNIVDEKIEEVIKEGATVSSISYGTF